MDRTELTKLFEDNDLVMAFDTNAVYGDRPGSDPFVGLCDTINRINLLRSSQPHISMVISAPVYVEKLHDMRQRYKERFNPDLPRGFLESKGIKIESFDLHHAEHLSEVIGEAYPTERDWFEYKRKRCLRCLNLQQEHHENAKGSGKNCGATVDWLIAGHAHASSYLLVTNDRGPEFRAVEHKAKLLAVCEVANTLLERLERDDSRVAT